MFKSELVFVLRGGRTIIQHDNANLVNKEHNVGTTRITKVESEKDVPDVSHDCMFSCDTSLRYGTSESTRVRSEKDIPDFSLDLFSSTNVISRYGTSKLTEVNSEKDIPDVHSLESCQSACITTDHTDVRSEKDVPEVSSFFFGENLMKDKFLIPLNLNGKSFIERILKETESN